MNSDTIYIITIIVCILLSGYFSATETAFSSLNKIRIKNMADKKNKRAELVLKLSDNYDSLLSTILIGNNIVNIATASIATLLFVKLLGNDTGPAVSTAVITIAVLIFGEVTPKSIAKETPEKFAMFSAPFLNILVVLLTPFNYLFRQWKKVLHFIFKFSGDNGITEEELISIIEEVKEEGGIDEQESTLIKGAIEFKEEEAVDILTPRIDITAVPANATKDEIADTFRETGYSRLPVYEETIDHIIGIIYLKDFYNYSYNKEIPVPDIIRPTVFVPKNKKISVLLKELQKKKTHIAVVVDEFGGTIGIITLEDILEELVGEIWDEHDEVSIDIEEKSDCEYIVSGHANIDKVFSKLEIETDDEEIESSTINGWIMKTLGKVPENGDTFIYKDYSVHVVEVDEKRIEKVLFKKEHITE